MLGDGLAIPIWIVTMFLNIVFTMMVKVLSCTTASQRTNPLEWLQVCADHASVSETMCTATAAALCYTHVHGILHAGMYIQSIRPHK